jgi:hypothetical protein
MRSVSTADMQFLRQRLLFTQWWEHPEGMADLGADRISVLRDNRVVPLMPSRLKGGGEQPWRGVLLEQHAVSAIEIPEHEHRELCLHLQTSGDEAMEWWSWGRHGVERTAPGSMIFLPAGTRAASAGRAPPSASSSPFALSL